MFENTIDQLVPGNRTKRKKIVHLLLNNEH